MEVVFGLRNFLRNTGHFVNCRYSVCVVGACVLLTLEIVNTKDLALLPVGLMKYGTILFVPTE